MGTKASSQLGQFQTPAGPACLQFKKGRKVAQTGRASLPELQTKEHTPVWEWKLMTLDPWLGVHSYPPDDLRPLCKAGRWGNGTQTDSSGCCLVWCLLPPGGYLWEDQTSILPVYRHCLRSTTQIIGGTAYLNIQGSEDIRQGLKWPLKTLGAGKGVG